MSKKLKIYCQQILYNSLWSSTLYGRQHEGGNFFMWQLILVGILALIAGVALGFFIARKYMMSYLKKNPPINEQMLKVMMMQMGMKPSQKKINQMMNAINKQTK
jgi:uncharacterized protein YneF (UPF0154 family)